MKHSHFFFIGDLRQLLPPSCRDQPFELAFRGQQSAKHLIESLGVPHTEIGYIENQASQVNLNYLVKNGDQLKVYPIDHHRIIKPAEGIRFVLDNHLGKLATLLRMLGFDTQYRNDFQDHELAEISTKENRILLTRDRRLLMRNAILFGCLVRSKSPDEQCVQVIQRYDLVGEIKPFQRCIRCNGLLQPVDKAQVTHKLKELTIQYFNDFCRCAHCGQVYWQGSHYLRMQKRIEHVIQTSKKEQTENRDGLFEQDVSRIS